MDKQKARLNEILADTLKEWDVDCPPETTAQMADHLVDNGVIVPPCQVGDSVYVIDSEDESCKPYVLSVMVTAIGYDIGGFWITMCLPSGFKMSPHCGERCFGKTVFLTKKEAVQALKERES